MKKILLSLTATVLTALSVNAQVDYGFETWADVPNAATGVQDPKGWASFNVLTNTFIGMQQSVFKETAAPSAGSAAAKIVTQAIPSTITVPGYDTVGVLAIGKVDLLSRTIQLGTPGTDRPAIYHFVTKYQPVGLDSAWVEVQLTKRNTTTNITEVVAKGKWTSNVATTAWTAGMITLTYDAAFNNISPDSIRIIISSSSLYKPKVGSTLYIDDITASGWVSTNELPGIKNNVTVFPVPAKTSVSFTSSLSATVVEIIDITGRNVGTFQMSNNKVTVETSKYESGMYIYNVLNAQQEVVGRGRFEVIK